jgi:hypothetical protein
MRRISIWLLLLAANTTAWAQVVATVEIKNPELRALQERFLDDLKQLGSDIVSTPTEYPFYLSRRLDLDEQQQKGADQRSIRFDHYKDKTVLEITGNYYAAYSMEKMNPDQRARETFRNVVQPILKVAVPRFQNNPSVQAYALEISHHVIGKVMGVSVERPENLVVVLPQQAAIRFLAAGEDSAQQAALLEGEYFLNADPVAIWLNGEGPHLAEQLPPQDSSSGRPTRSVSASVVMARSGEEKMPAALAMPTLEPVKPAAPPAPPRDISPQALAALQASRKLALEGMVKELEPQAHFVSYAAPSFTAFRNAVYLELSINTTLKEPPGGSRYRLAALAFADHVAHLIRPVLGYFKDDSEFDGLGFSTNLHLAAAKTDETASSEAVEFFFPFSALRCYERYDCTGQQLIDAGSVLINGERVSLNLQIAEGGINR